MQLGVNQPKAAIVAIDLHRGHLDMEVATMPTTPAIARQVIKANNHLFDWARNVGVPVIHVMTQYRDATEIVCNPFWRTRAEDPTATRKNVLRHNIRGMPGVNVISELYDRSRDLLVDTKKRYDCFLGTDLDFLLRARGINVLIVTGVNTNSCILATAAAANVRDYCVIVAKDCVETMDGSDLHEAGLLCISTAFGLVADTNAIMNLAAFAREPQPAAFA
ncbi:MAG: cysteine hydrolase [Methylocella sp.]